MGKHIFDRATRIPFKEAEELDLDTWLPPVIDETGHLVQAEPRDGVRRENEEADVDAKALEINQQEMEKIREQARGEGLEQGKEEGINLGKQEGVVAGKEQGFTEGKEEGFSEGHRQGLEGARVQIEEKLGQVNKLLTSLTHALNEQDYKLEQALLNLVVEIARVVVKRDLKIDSGHIMQVVKEALAALPPSRDNLRICINPSDMALVQEAVAQGGENWRVIADEAVEIGGCRVETDQSVVDFTTESRFRTMVDQILSKQLGLPPDGTVQEPEFDEAPTPVIKPVTGDEVEESPAAPGLIDEAHALSGASAAKSDAAQSSAAKPATTEPTQPADAPAPDAPTKEPGV